jgi:HEAT repeat protein
MNEQMKILADPEQPEERRIEAARAIGRSKEGAALVDRLFVVIETAEAFLARAIVEALRELGAHDLLSQRLSSQDARVRADAAKKLSRMQDDRAADALLAAAKDPEPSVRRAAVHALSYLRGGRTLEALLAAIRDKDPETRAYAAAGLGRSSEPRATRALLAAKESEEDDVVKDFIEAAMRKMPKASAEASAK